MDGLRSLPARFRIIRTASVFILISLLAYPAAGAPAPQAAAAAAAQGPGVTLYSRTPERPPRIDGAIADGEWNGAAVYGLPHGRLYLLNDYISVYLLIDLSADTHADPLASPPGDGFALRFDVDRNGRIDPGVDLMLASQAEGLAACRFTGAGPQAWTGCASGGSSFSAGWGATPDSSRAHRFYEIAVSRAEISPSAAASPRPDLPELPAGLRMSVQVSSQRPAIDDLAPAAQPSDFSALLDVALDDPQMELLILGHPDDLDALQPLKAHKDYTDLPAYVLDWQAVALAYQAWGYDDPERIKKALAAYEAAANTRYALLVGDADRFPMRYTITDREDDNHRAHWAYYSADLYYADLYEADNATFEDWDANDDHYYGELHGEQLTGVVNVDQVNLAPDIAVGRVPASSTAEVITYVNKVINYEFNAYQKPWRVQSLMVATTDWIADACSTKQSIRTNSLLPQGYTVERLYQAGNPCTPTDPPSSANINALLNQGAGLVNYIGHGSANGWAIPGDEYNAADLAGLTNQDRLTVAVSAGCGTARYTAEPPYDAYTDANGVNHTGTNAGEIFVGKPPRPAPLQTGAHNLHAFVEDMTVERVTGAVGYIGFVTGAQSWSLDLDTSFYESLAYNWDTLGGMWNYMVRRYYQINPDPGSLASPSWWIVAGFHQPWKFHLFGDPSLRIRGVSRFQKADFAGEWAQNHDGWPGTLALEPVPGSYIDSMPNLLGTHTGGLGSRDAYGYVRTWKYPIPDSPDWPDTMFRFFIDFNATPTHTDDQQFDGYLFTHDRSRMAGLTWWGGTPFGFLALKTGGSGAGYQVQYETAAPAILPKTDFLGDYVMNHDGWPGRLTLIAGPEDPPHPNITGVYRDGSGNPHAVRAYVRTSTYGQPPEWGPDHQIELYIDFNDTGATTDDQKFVGYLFSQTKRAMAGLTWWNSNPFGFYAIKVTPLYLPLTQR